MNSTILNIIKNTFPNTGDSVLKRNLAVLENMFESIDRKRIAFRRVNSTDLQTLLIAACLSLNRQKLKIEPLNPEGRRFFYSKLDTGVKSIPKCEKVENNNLSFVFDNNKRNKGARGVTKRSCPISNHYFIEISEEYCRTNKITNSQKKFLEKSYKFLSLLLSSADNEHLFTENRLNFCIDVFSDDPKKLYESLTNLLIKLDSKDYLPLDFQYPIRRISHKKTEKYDEMHLLIPVINLYSSKDELLENYLTKPSDLLIIDGNEKAEKYMDDFLDRIEIDVLPPTLLIYDKIKLKTLNLFSSAYFRVSVNKNEKSLTDCMEINGKIASIITQAYNKARHLFSFKRIHSTYNLLIFTKKIMKSTIFPSSSFLKNISDNLKSLEALNKEHTDKYKNRETIVHDLEMIFVELESLVNDEFKKGSKYNYIFEDLILRLDNEKKYAFIFANEFEKDELKILLERNSFLNIDLLNEKELLVSKEMYDSIYVFYWNPNHLDFKYILNSDKIIHVLYPIEYEWLKAHRKHFSKLIEKQKELTDLDEIINESFNKLSDDKTYIELENNEIFDEGSGYFDGFKIFFKDGSYLITTNNARIRRLNYSSETVEQVSPDDLEYNDTIVIYSGTDEDIIDFVINKMREKKPEHYDRMLELSKKWKHVLKNIDRKQMLFKRLKELGYKNPSHTVKRWIENERIIRPQKLEVIDIIAELTHDEDFKRFKDDVKVSCKNAFILRHTIGKLLVLKTTNILFKENVDPLINEIINSGAVSILDVMKVTKVRSVPNSQKNKLIKTIKKNT